MKTSRWETGRSYQPSTNVDATAFLGHAHFEPTNSINPAHTPAVPCICDILVLDI